MSSYMWNDSFIFSQRTVNHCALLFYTLVSISYTQLLLSDLINIIVVRWVRPVLVQISIMYNISKCLHVRETISNHKNTFMFVILFICFSFFLNSLYPFFLNSLSQNTSIDARDFSSHPTLGFIIFYSANRKASLSAVK